jgi:ATP-dependent Clp protease ATP-binding subunit ClpB
MKLEIDKIAGGVTCQGRIQCRPLKRFIQQHLETPISRMIIAGDLAEGSQVHAVVGDGNIFVG